MIKVSIITVCYNSQNSIRKTIESVLNQTYKNIEYIIIDGQSTDGTIEIVQEYTDAFEGRMRVVSEPDHGIYDAMNKGIGMATGELIGILNSDDYYEEKAVECMIDSMSGDKYQILYGFMRSMKGNQEYCIGRSSHLFLKEEMIGHPACFVTKAIYDDFGGFDLQYVSVADYDFMLRMSEIKEVKYRPVDHLITNFAMGGMSASQEAWMDLLRMKRNRGMISEKEYQKEIIKDKIFRIYIRCKDTKRRFK